MARRFATLAVTVLFLLHQDFWYWNTAHPIVFGVLPIGLFYHVGYTVVTSLVLWALVRGCWPSDLDKATASE
jgi:Protein of unknown function (DUF3311)